MAAFGYCEDKATLVMLNMRDRHVTALCKVVSSARCASRDGVIIVPSPKQRWISAAKNIGQELSLHHENGILPSPSRV